MTVKTLSCRVTAIERRSSIDFLHAVLESHARGELVMPVEPGTQAVFPGIGIVERRACAMGGGWFNRRIEPRHDSDGAQIALTSGTTGKPKAMLLSHRALGDVTTRLIDVMNLDDGIREYVGIPVTYSFGFGRIRAIAAVGGASFLPERGFRVDEFAAMLERGKVNALSAVPTLLRLVLDQRQRFKDCGRALRWLEIGSQAMTRAEKEAILDSFPRARIVQHYGLTEASRSTFLPISPETVEAFDSVGQPNGGVSVRITQDGLINIRGAHLADGIITEDGVRPITDPEGWLVTGDLGHRKGEYLYFDGRADDLINVAGIKVPSEAFEERLVAQLGNRFPLAVAPGRDRLRGQIAVIAHEPFTDSAMEMSPHEAVAAIAAELGIGDGYALFPVSAIPRTETKKVKRNALTDGFSARETAPVATPVDPVEIALDKLGTQTGIAEAFVKVFGEPARDRDASFESLGGDSLHYVTMLTELERCLPCVPEDWDRRTIGELSGLSSPPKGVAGAFILIFGDSARNESASFQSLGGDSLHYVMLLTELEHHLPAVPQDWDTMSIGALSALAAGQLLGTASSPVEPESKRRLPSNLDTVRGLACVLVVAMHVVGAAPDEGLKIPAGSAWHRVMDALDLIRLPLFTALAGFLYGAMPATRNGFFAYMKRKAGQLLIPLLFATLAFWVLRQITYGHNERSLFWAYVYGYQHLWYIDALLLIFAFASFVDTRIHPSWKIWAGIVAAVVLFAWTVPDIPIMHVRSALSLLPFFIFGLLLYRVPDLLESRALLVGSVIALISIIALQQAAPEIFRAINPTGVLMWLCGMASVIVALRLFPRLPAIESIAAYTFTIYLWHPAANGAVRNFLWGLGVNSTGLLFVIGLASGILVPILMHRVFMRLPKIISAPVIGR